MQSYRDSYKPPPLPPPPTTTATTTTSYCNNPELLASSASPGRSSLFYKTQRNCNFSDPANSHRGRLPAQRLFTGGMSSPTPSNNEAGSCHSAAALLRQNQELRQRLAEEASNYRRRLDTYKQVQQNQATLVSRLQSKIQQYRQRCSDLEDRMQEIIKPPLTSCHSPKLTTSPTTNPVLCSTAMTLGHSSQPCSSSLESPPSPSSPPTCGGGRDCLLHEDNGNICRRLDEEHKKSEQLLTQNSALRQQLEESNRTNESLTNDLQKLTNDWSNLRDELLMKEDEFKEEEQAFKDYYSSEHNRLLRMWREVVAVKRAFRDMQMAAKNQMDHMGLEMSGTIKEMVGVCNNVSLVQQQSKSRLEEQLLAVKRENDELQSQLATLKVQHDSARHEILERDQRLLERLNQLKKLEDRCLQAESQAILAARYNEEIERLNNCMREIAQAVVLDAESTERDANVDDANTADELNDSVMRLQMKRDASVASAAVSNKSPKRSSIRSSQALAEGTISAVQAALHKYQLALHDTQVKFQNANDDLRSTKTQLNTSEGTKALLTNKMQQLTEKLDSSNHRLTELLKERDSLLNTLDELREQKQKAEQGRAEINNAFEILSVDYEKLQLNYGKLQKRSDSLEEDKKAIELEIQRTLKDKNLIEMNLRTEEDRCSRLREETISLREELNRVNLSRELLEQQHIESDNLISILEKQKADLEYDYDKILLDKCDLQEKLEKLTNNNSTTSDELKAMESSLNEVQEVRKKLSQQLSDQTNELTEVKRDLSNIEKLRLELETENVSLSEKMKCFQMEKEKILQDLSCITRDRSDIHNQLTAMCRKKEALNEELLRTRQRLEQTNETNNRLNRNLESISKELEEKQVFMDMHEKDAHRLQELLSALRSEKESLDMVLFDTNNTLEATEEKRQQTERHLQEALLREESLKNTVARLQKDLEQCQRRAQETKTQLTNAARATENEFQQQLADLKAMAEETIKKHSEDTQQLRNALDKRMQQALQALQTAKDDEIEKQQERLESLQNHLENLIQQHEEALIRAENEKQQALLIAHRDKQSLMEKLDMMNRALKAEEEAMERTKRDCQALDERQRNEIAHLKEEIVTNRTKEEEQKAKLEDNQRKLEVQINALLEERDKLLHQCDEVKMEMRLKEDKMDTLTNELQDSLRKIKEAEGHIDSLRKELTDSRRQLADSNIERDKYSSSNKELREHVKRVESAKREQIRANEECLQKLAHLEETRNNLEAERCRLSNTLKDAENNLSKSKQDLQNTKNLLQKTQLEFSQKNEGNQELQNKLSSEIEIKEKSMQELTQIKKQMADLEGSLCTTRQELGRARCHANQEEHRFHNREQELMARLEEARGREKRLEDQKHNLEVCLADATQQMQELKTRLSGAESRLRALDDQLSCMEMQKRDTEQKLSSIVHTLRRIAGIQIDGSINANTTHRLVSPSRRFSPVRSVSGAATASCHDFDARSSSNCPDAVTAEVNPDLIRKGVRCLMHKVAQIEREKEDFKMQLSATRKQLQEAVEQQGKYETKISKLQQMLRHLQQEKCSLDTERNIKVAAINGMEEKLKRKDEECQQLREKYCQIEMQLSTIMEENIQNDERLDKCRQQVNKLENDKRHLQEELAKMENKATKLDLQRVSLEGDMTRLQMSLQEKDCNIRQAQDRINNQSKTIVQLEDRCTSLKTSLDQMKERLQKAAVIEAELRGEIKAIQKELNEQGHCSQSNEDKLKLLQKTLTISDNEKRILGERLDKAQTNLNELRRSQQAQLDNIQRLQDQVNNLEVQKSALESQLRISKWSQETGEKNIVNDLNGDLELGRQLKIAQREKNELRNKVQMLQDKVKQQDNERKSKFSTDGVYDRTEKKVQISSYYDGGAYDTNRSESALGVGNALYNCGVDHSVIEQENRDLRLKVRRLETLLAEKESELARCKARVHDSSKCLDGLDTERYRSAQLHAEKLLDAREQAHRQQVLRLENQISMLREQLAQESKRRQQYILRSSKANREVQQLRHTLGDSLRHVSQQPLDTNLLESESRRLDNAVTMSLPPTTCRDYERN